MTSMRKILMFVTVCVLCMVGIFSSGMAEDAVEITEDGAFSEYEGSEDDYPDYMNSVIMDDPEYFLYWDEDVDPVDVILTEEPVENNTFILRHQWHNYYAIQDVKFGPIEMPCSADELMEYFGVKDQILTLPAQQKELYSWIPLFNVSFRCGSFLMDTASAESGISTILGDRTYVFRLSDATTALLDTFMYTGDGSDFVYFVITQLGSPKCILAKENQLEDTGYGYSNYTLCYQYNDLWMLIEVVEDYTGEVGKPTVQWMDELSFTYLSPESIMTWLNYDKILY